MRNTLNIITFAARRTLVWKKFIRPTRMRAPRTARANLHAPAAAPCKTSKQAASTARGSAAFEQPLPRAKARPAHRNETLFYPDHPCAFLCRVNESAFLVCICHTHPRRQWVCVEMDVSYLPLSILLASIACHLCRVGQSPSMDLLESSAQWMLMNHSS